MHSLQVTFVTSLDTQVSKSSLTILTGFPQAIGPFSVRRKCVSPGNIKVILNLQLS